MTAAAKATFLSLLLATAVLGQNHPELQWQEFETEHFRILYHQGLEAAGRRAAEIAEAAYGPVTELYDYRPEDRVRIVLKGYDDYANGAAFFYHDTIEIWTTALDHDFDLRGSSDWLTNVITHEFVHIISLGAARKGPQRVPALYLQYFGYQREPNRPDVLVGYPDVISSYPVTATVVPMWFAEGIAQYQAEGARQDRWDSHRDMILRTAVLNDAVLDFDEMGVFGKRGFGNEFVYDHGYGLARYIGDTYGAVKLADLCRAMASWPAFAIDGAIEKVLGISAAELHENWLSSMRQAYEVQVASLGPLREGAPLNKGEPLGVQVNKGDPLDGAAAEESAPENDGFSNIQPSYSPDGRYLAYLSTGKRDHGPHVLVLRDLASEEEEVLTGPITSTLGWSPDSRRILFVRKDGVEHGSRQADIYEYDLDGPEMGLGRKIVWTLPAMVTGLGPDQSQVRRLTDGARALYPSYSPDGEQIAYIGSDGVTNNLAVMKSDGSDVRYLTEYDDGTLLFTPRWSPDGSKLACSISRNGQRDIAVLDLVGESGALAVNPRMAASPPMAAEFPQLKALVATRGTDRDPSWSADGKEVIYSSDVTGIFNIYALDIESGSRRQLSNVVGGALSPTVSPSGDVAFTSYGPQGYGVRILDAAKVAKAPQVDLETSAAAAGAVHAAGRPGRLNPGERPAIRSLQPSTMGRPEPYGIDFLKTSLMPRLLWDEGRFKGGLYVSASDVLSKQIIFAGAAVAPSNRDRDLFFIYENRKWRPTLFIEYFHQQRQSARGDSSEERDLVITGMRFKLNQVNVGLRGKIGSKGNIALSLTYDRYDASVESRFFDPLSIAWVRQKPFGYTYLNGFDLGLTYRYHAVARTRDREINPRGGRTIFFRYDRMFNKFIEGFDQQNSAFLQEEFLDLHYNQLTLDWHEYVSLPRRTTLGLRFFGGWIANDNVDDKEVVNDFFDYHLGGLNYMKGYTFYSLEGRKAVMGQASWRFPLLPNLKTRILHLYLDKVYGAFYGDLGKAWDDDYGDPDPVYGRTGALRDLGGQLRFDLISYYNLPTKVQMDVAYGVDEVRDRSPWKLYLTVLFGYI